MNHIDLALGAEMPVREAKEMLSTRNLPDGRTEIRINHSSYSLISSCKRKAHYALNRGLVSRHESEATLFGRAIHGALEVYYTAPRSSRRAGTSECDDSVANMEAGLEPLPHGRCVRCAAQARFLEIAEPLKALDSSEKRSRRNGTSILDAYFDNYSDDPFVVLSDELGPIAERRVEMVLAEESDSRVVYFGTMDCAMINEETKHVLLCDHKTTSSLGADFLGRISPNFQFAAYMAAFRREHPEYDTRTFMVNGLLVAKTKQSFARQFTEISDSLIAEWRESMLDTSYDWWARLKSEGPYTMNSPAPCGEWGGCQYKAICEVPGDLKESIISAQYNTQDMTKDG